MTEWTRHQVTFTSPLQFHITLAVGTTVPRRKELTKNVFHRDPSGRTGGYSAEGSQHTRMLQNLEPKRRRKFNPPFK